ncbi:GNAT family N-acetyltransferase [Poseidonocella sedimentorum]|uniref:L-ornithine N(alpha)-acyltransferase n=1 Tax=Poseidonocella sedimentorum TaxID=871652 RepID=A0A1I6DG73_9RHOB|nr:GNAT family N-acetyltransferase [Poseidonocella sedimentorum]SFR04381.1 Putative hemolysin [Poseidonocella sedimentorum]
MPALSPTPRRARYTTRFAACDADLRAAQRLRWRCFLADDTGGAGEDADAFDPICDHLLVETRDGGRLVCCFRLLRLGPGEIARSYAAQFYDLAALESFEGPMVEMGRFCIDAEFALDPDILRLAWGAMTRYVDDHGVQMLFGCSSFQGTAAEEYLDAFTVLQARHLAPKRWLPRVKAPDVFRFAKLLRRTPDARLAMKRMPPLLRTYLAMGGWVSDHAVVDRAMNTLHVFTGVEIGAIPAARRRRLRGLEGGARRLSD